MLEQKYITLYNSTDENFGYNLQTGGKNHNQSEETKRKIGQANSISLRGKKWSEEQKKFMSELFSGENNPFYGKHHSDETKKKISESRKGKCAGEDHPFYGKKHSEEDLKKISQNRKNKGGRKVKCINTGEIFDTLAEAARWCGLKTGSSISQVCLKTGKQSTAGKHPITKEKLLWEYVEN